jgi:hypothetical protein
MGSFTPQEVFTPSTEQGARKWIGCRASESPVARFISLQTGGRSFSQSPDGQTVQEKLGRDVTPPGLIEEYFDGLREAVLESDGFCCRVCGASGRRERSIIVHHRVPGKSLLHLMISLCLRCHAKAGRSRCVLSEMPPLLLQLWRDSPAIERVGIGLSRGDRNSLPLLLMSASLVGALQKDRVSHGNGGTGQEGMLVRGLVERRGFLRSVSRR